MEKQKPWQFFLIAVILLLTVYNILPTVFYYSQDLGKPLDEKSAVQVSETIIKRINQLEDDSIAWLKAFCAHLSLNVENIEWLESSHQRLKVEFKDGESAEIFKKFLPRAGEMISFSPAQLYLSPKQNNDPLKVWVERRIPLHFEKSDAQKLFHFSHKRDKASQVSDFYRMVILDRVAELGQSIAGKTPQAELLYSLLLDNAKQDKEETLSAIARQIDTYAKLFDPQSPISKRYFAGFSRGLGEDVRRPARQLADLFQKAKERIIFKASVAKEEIEKEEFKDPAELSKIAYFEEEAKLFESCIDVLKKYEGFFKDDLEIFKRESILSFFERKQGNSLETLALEGRHPFIESIVIDWNSDQLKLELYPQIQQILENKPSNDQEAYQKDRLQQLLFNEIARISRSADENLKPSGSSFLLNFNEMTDSQSIIAFKLGELAQKYEQKILLQIAENWQREHQDLLEQVYPVRSYNDYNELSNQEQRLGIFVYAPANDPKQLARGFKNNSIYVVAKSLHSIMQKYENFPDSEEAKAFMEDVQNLRDLLAMEGFSGYPGSLPGISAEYVNDYIFELSDYYSQVLKASRENFSIHGSKRYAILELSDKEQRLLTLNRIEKEMHEDLMKWRDEHRSAQVDLDLTKKYLVPPPSKSILWNNFVLSAKKYFRGDDNKILKWGLDLSGGKMVQIGLRDQNNHPVQDETNLKQAVNELTTRVNKMGLSEINIRIEGDKIVLDFPGSQGFSASELIKASSMYFHVVNEQFSIRNPRLANSVNQFLQDVWNEAVVTNRKDPESIQEIAYDQLSQSQKPGQRPRSEHAQRLFESGLRLAHPQESLRSNRLDETLSNIAVYQGDEQSQWRGQGHPLLIVFQNYALEGSDLENIHAAYDPEKGNILSFSVKGSFAKKDETDFSSPRESLYSWTSSFAQNKISGTAKEEYSQNSGWRMAVILNGYAISEPTLNQPLSNQAMIYGKFSQREVNKLVSDLKAGSLSFTPKILSEQNVSPDLGKEERERGIFSAFVGLLLVISCMIFYYRFGGFVASVAVVLNLLILWGVLQNLSAALSLAGIAGIILTVGMAVDANVLIFERIREEFAISGRISSAIHNGYQKAFVAILDSNLTTIMAALILMQFDSGPIKGFALTLIIGIASSMFTALFLTRYFFAGWVQNPKNKELKMAKFIGNTNFDFLSKSKFAILASVFVIILGSYFLVEQRKSIMGMDFSGGYALNVQLDETKEGNYRQKLLSAMMENGAEDGDVQIRELNKPNHLRIQYGMSMEESGHPFHNLPIESDSSGYEYQKNPRIVWTVESLEKAGLSIEKERLEDLDKTWTSISGQFSDVMRQNALFGLFLAIISILFYITLRFEFDYAISSVIGIAHDIFLTLGVIGLLHKIGVPIQMNMESIAAFMTMIGYSLNDTIIVFDRIREDVHIMRKKSFSEVVNHALNITLSRTVLTSGTTLLVLLSLLIFGGNLIFDFALVMTLGVILGTISSWFIATPILLYLHEYRQKALKFGEA